MNVISPFLVMLFETFLAGLADIISRRLTLAISGLFLTFGSSLLAASLYNYTWYTKCFFIGLGIKYKVI